MKFFKTKYRISLTLVLFFTISLVLPSYVAEAAKSTIEFDKTSVTAYAGGDKVKLKITGTDKPVVWKSNDNKIAKVTQYGNIYGLKKGTTTITATIEGKTYKCEVTVKNPYLSPTTFELNVNDTKKLILKGFNKQIDIKWKSNDKAIAIVDSEGEVTAKGEGTTTITATINNEEYNRKIVVTKKLNIKDIIKWRVKYINHRSVEYVTLEKCQRLFFSLQDKNYDNMSAAAVIDIKIINDIGEKVYERTHNIESNDFNYWTTPFYGNKLLVNIDIPDTDIISGSSKSGIIYFTVYSSNRLYGFEESKLTINNLPYNSIANNCTLSLPSVPIILSEYNYRGNLDSTIRLDEITYSFEESYDKKVYLTLYLTGEKIFDTSTRSMDFIYYKLYKDGYVVKSSFYITDSLSVGDKFKNTSFKIYGLEPGVYNIEIFEGE